MQSMSPRWEAAIRAGGNPVTMIDVIFPGEGTVFSDLPVPTGSTTFTRGDGERTATGSIVVSDADLFPAFNELSPISPYGAELVIKTGFRYTASTPPEVIEMGVFPIISVRGNRAGASIPTVEFADRSKFVEGTHFIAPVDFGGQSAIAAIETVVTYAAPFYPGTGVEWDVEFHPDLADITLPLGTMFQEGRWSFARKLAKMMGAEIYFDRFGACRIDPIPSVAQGTPLSDSVWTLDEGRLPGNLAILIDADQTISRENIYNGVVVRGTTNANGETQPYALVTDDNPGSRTYYNGPFGKRIKQVDMPLLTSDDACLAAATAILRDLNGLQAAISFSTVGNPALDLGDLLKVRYRNGVEELHMLDAYTLDYATYGMTGSTRSPNYVEVGS